MKYLTYWDDPEVSFRELAELDIFEIIEREVSKKFFDKEIVCSIIDSFAIRAYLPVKRDFNDIDLVFPNNCPASYILDLANKCDGEPKIINTHPNGSFVRVVYYLPSLERIGGDFRLDFHLGGSIYKEHKFLVDEQYFSNTAWKKVSSYFPQVTASISCAESDQFP